SEEDREGLPAIEPYRLLLVATPDDGRAAIVLDGVERLEEIPANHVENMGRHEVVQYRGNVMDVVWLSRVLKERRVRAHRGQLGERPRDPLHVVVHHHEDHFAGIVVDEVIDIVEHTLEERLPARRLGVVFSVLIRDRVTEVIDTDWVIRHSQHDGSTDG
ncbi:MAG: chemotaxis protein CheW, partial [Myxococcales bacterium]|nr:chemotaxis protein CheW [Myxococcales bacterium]